MNKLKNRLIIVVACICLLAIIATISSCSRKNNVSPKYEITEAEREMLARLIYFEAHTCSDECQRNICSVVFNRIESGYWGDSIEETIKWKGSFSTLNNVLYSPVQATDKEYKNVDYVLQHGRTIPSEVRYFRNNHHFTWESYKGYCSIDNVYFGYFTNPNIH